jgi:type IV pilus assembly protein PilQ
VKRISIDFTETDVRTVIDLVAAAGGYRVIFTPEVAGSISITLVDRPWEDALATVLRARRLREVRHEDVMLVSPVARGQKDAPRSSP